MVPVCKFNEGGPRDTIILYVESGYAPLAVEVPDGVGVGARAGARVAIEGAGGGAGVATGGDASVGVEEEFDWLNKGLEGEDFVDDIFGGKVEIVYRDPDKLSYYEIEGICEELGIDEQCRVHYLGLGGNLEQNLRLI